jgi:hypothetical protein
MTDTLMIESLQREVADVKEMSFLPIEDSVCTAGLPR